MTESEALARMILPSHRRKGKPLAGVIQIWVTRACNLACYGCTQGANFGGNPGMITPEQFEEACQSLQHYFGVVGVFGGNPCLHPHFPDLCRILDRHIPFERRGLWANNLNGHGRVCAETFNPAVSNLNVHLDRNAYDEIRRDWPQVWPFGMLEDSRHSPPYVALKDLIPDAGRRWEMIANCDINLHWSAMIGVFRGELRAWFCEIAGAQAMLHQDNDSYPDTGLGLWLSPGIAWWQGTLDEFAPQIRKHCHECGVPLKGFGNLAQAATGAEQLSATHADLKPKKVRAVQIVTQLAELGTGRLRNVCKYLENSRL